MNRSEFTGALKTLGITPGDRLYVRASLGALGKLEGEVFDVVVGGLTDAVGPMGTVIAPAFTAIGSRFSSDRTPAGSRTTPISGALSRLLLSHPKAQRSGHPTHSFVAIGEDAEALLSGHDQHTSCFQPINRLAAMDGKMLLLGCNDSSPGFSTVHVAQHELGLTQRHLLRHFQRVWLEGDKGLTPWIPAESPGCSASFDRFYPAYIRDKNLVTGAVGSAWCVLVLSARRALKTDLEILSDNPCFVDCGRPTCWSCGLRSYQIWRVPVTLLSSIAGWVKRLNR